VLSRSRAMHERLRAFTLIFLALLVVVLTGGAGPAVNASAQTPAGQGECEAAGGTWDRSPFRPEGYCVSDTQEKCVARGGKWQRVCWLQDLHCVRPTSDGGKPCTDSSQCEKGCVAVIPSLTRDARGLRPPARSGADAPEGPVFGECRRDDDPCGCRQYVRNGKLVAPAFCAD
jgi:hypothetical protein